MSLAGLAGCASTSKSQKPAPAVATAAAAPPAYPHTPDAAFRDAKPAPLPGTPHFQAPVPVERKLKNGLRVLINENHQVPLVVADLVVETGINGNPLAKPGLAEFTAAMLDEGTQTESSLQIAAKLEDLAAQLSASASSDSTEVDLNCLTETLPQALDVMADVALHPAFKAADIARVKKAYLTGLAQQQVMPGFLAQNAARRVLYGEASPWGQPVGGTIAAVTKLGTRDLQSFHKTYFVPQNAVLVVSGDVTPDALVKLLDARFGHWKGKTPRKATVALPPPNTQRKILVIDHPGTQSRVAVVHRMLTAASPDVVPMKTANYILGGLFSSRLNLNLREDKAYSYGVFSRIAFNSETGVFSAQGNIIAQHTPEAIAEMEKEFDRFKDGKVTPEELHAAKSAYVRSLPSLLETNGAVAGSIAELVIDGLPLDYFVTLPAKVAAVTDADIARVAQVYVQPQTWPVVVVGPVHDQMDRLKALNLGSVEALDLGQRGVSHTPSKAGAKRAGPRHQAKTPAK